MFQRQHRYNVTVTEKRTSYLYSFATTTTTGDYDPRGFGEFARLFTEQCFDGNATNVRHPSIERCCRKFCHDPTAR